MKKVLLVPAVIVPFILGVFLADTVRDSLNSLFGSEVFVTKRVLLQRLEESEQQKTEYQKQVNKRNQDLNKLVREISLVDDPKLVKEALLTSIPGSSSQPNQIVLKPAESEMFIKPAADDDEIIKDIKKVLNKKTRTMLNVSEGILKEKVASLNMSLLDMNNQLKQKYLDLNIKMHEVEEYKEELEKHKKQINDLEGIKQELENTVGVLETKIEDGRLKVHFEGDILFDSGKHKLKKKGMALLKKVLPILQKNIKKNDIFIAGHTDNVPIRKDSLDKYRSNWELSTFRAIEVVRSLIKMGLSPGKLTAAGYGEFKPIANNATSKGKARNRRVELFIIPKIIRRSPKN